MKSRAEIKAIAKDILRQNYSMALVPLILYMLIGAVATGITLGIGSILILPLNVGMFLVYIMLWRHENPQLESMFTSAFTENYVRKLGGMLWMNLFVFLWSLLLFIPGFVKSYSYAMTPYILAKYPGVPATQALKLSMRVMEGHKLDLFVVDLSFIGWHLLGALTFGILTIFYVNPYMMITRAGCLDGYLADALSRGVISEQELLA